MLVSEKNENKRDCIRVMVSLFFAAFFLLCGCSFITFEKFSLSSNIDSKTLRLGGNFAELYFSAEPDKRLAENLVTLKHEGQVVTPEFGWLNGALTVKPREGWKKGGFYSFTVNGTIKLTDGRSYRVFLDEYFYFGGSDSFLILESHSPVAGGTAMEDEPLLFVFNKAVSVNSFYETFKITPPREVKMEFSADGKKVSVAPKNGWEKNTFYDWSLSRLRADDGYALEYDLSGRFYTEADFDYPRLVGVFPAIIDSPIQYFVTDIRSLPPPLCASEPIGIVFSREMDFFSFTQTFSIEPSLKYYILRDEHKNDRFVFVPLEPYAAGTRYCITVSSSVKSLSGLSPISENKLYFENANTFLKVLDITFDGTTILTGPDSINDISSSKTITTHKLVNKKQLDISIAFSRPFTSEEQAAALKKINFSPLFPTSASQPAVVAALWNPLSASKLELSLQPVSSSEGGMPPQYYQLKITGGKNGLTDGSGSYLEEDICIILSLFS